MNTDMPLPPTALPVASELKILDGPEAEKLALKISEQTKVEFMMFPDGSFFKYIPRKDFEPQCLLVDAEGIQIAVARNVDIAEFLCNACNCLVIASKMNEESAKKMIAPPTIVVP